MHDDRGERRRVTFQPFRRFFRLGGTHILDVQVAPSETIRYVILKRCFDVVFSMLALAICGIPMVAIALSDLLHQSNVENFVSQEVRRAVIRAHAGIENAIRTGDPDAAHRRMARHIKSYRQQVAPVAPKGIAMALP